jgi:hypothetical protein
MVAPESGKSFLDYWVMFRRRIDGPQQNIRINENHR